MMMKDYAIGYKVWIKDKVKGLHVTEMHRQYRIYKSLQQHETKMYEQLLHAQHEYNLAQKTVQSQAQLMRDL
jgi:hypothetical protein